jgi:hypothetical protein
MMMALTTAVAEEVSVWACSDSESILQVEVKEFAVWIKHQM